MNTVIERFHILLITHALLGWMNKQYQIKPLGYSVSFQFIDFTFT